MGTIWVGPPRIENLSREVPDMEKLRMGTPPMDYLWLGPSRMGQIGRWVVGC